ncbi:MAG: hypothetical protein M1378_12365, partial [Bacteroidetes bacterium]|nr:hypothetical protein [Bacteroidota bacterium]
ELAYDAHFNEAESLFAEAARLSPERAESFFDVTQIHLWTYTFTQDRKAYNEFKKWYSITLEKLKTKLDADPADYRATYLLGETYMLRSVAGVTAHSYLDAFWSVKSAYSYFKKTLKLDPDFYDAYRGIGEIHYFLGFIPGSVRWAVGLFGLEPNRAKGLSEVRLAYQKGNTDRIRATISLAQIYSDYVAEYDSAETLMRVLVDDFPNNPMFNYNLAVVLIKEHRLHEAEKYLDKVLALNNPDFTVLNNFSLFLKGDVHFKLNDFSNAIKYNRMFLEKAHQPDYTGIANYRLAVSFRAVGDEAQMRKCLAAAMHGNQDIYDDARAKARSEHFLKKGISENELATLEAKNDNDAGRFEAAYSSLLPMADKIQDRDTRSEALLVLAEAAAGMRKYAEAARFAASADSIDNGESGWIKPRSWYVAALSSYHMGDLAAARNYLTRARDTKEYRSNNILNELVNGLELKVNGEKS